MQLEFCGQPLLRGQPHECFFASVTTGKLFEFCSCEYISNMIVSTSRWSHHCIKSFQIRSFSGPYSFQIQENTHEKNSVFGYFSRSALELNYSFPWVEITASQLLCVEHMILIDSMSDITLNSSLRKLYCRILFTLSTKKEVNCWALGNFSKGFMICVFFPTYVLERICLLLMFAAFGWIIYVIWQTVVEAFWCLLVIIANNFSAYFLQMRIFSLLACWCSHLWNKLHVNFLVCCQSKGT